MDVIPMRWDTVPNIFLMSSLFSIYEHKLQTAQVPDLCGLCGEYLENNTVFVNKM